MLSRSIFRLDPRKCEIRTKYNSVNFSDLTFATAQVKKHGGKVELVGIVSNGAETSRILGVLPLNSYNLHIKGSFSKHDDQPALCQIDNRRACLRAGHLEFVTRKYITFVSHSHLEVSTFSVA